jgi:predicted ATPase
VTAASDRTPVAVVTGFLGSGKTTLLNPVLRDPRFSRRCGHKPGEWGRSSTTCHS